MPVETRAASDGISAGAELKPVTSLEFDAVISMEGGSSIGVAVAGRVEVSGGVASANSVVEFAECGPPVEGSMSAAFCRTLLLRTRALERLEPPFSGFRGATWGAAGEVSFEA